MSSSALLPHLTFYITFGLRKIISGFLLSSRAGWNIPELDFICITSLFTLANLLHGGAWFHVSDVEISTYVHVRAVFS